MSRPADSQPEGHVEEHVESVREESPGVTQREFLKKLVGGAAGLTGLAAAGALLTPTPAEAAYSAGTAPYGFPPPVTTGDQITTNVHVNGHVQIRGYRPWIDVTAFGAPSTFANWADTAVSNAIASAPAQGAVLYFPAGSYAFQSPINITGKNITVAGAGRYATMLAFVTGGFDITNSRIAIRDMALISGQNSTVAIKITGGWTGGVPTTMPHIENIWIVPGDPAYSWDKGIELISCAGGKIERFEIDTNGGTHGIHLSGGSAITNIASGVIANAGTGIEVSDLHSEGLYCRGLEVLFCDTGFLLTAPGPGSAITDCHTKTRYYGIRTFNHGEMALIGNLLYGSDDPYVGIELDGNGQPSPIYGSHKCRVIGNLINSGTAGMGIHLTGNTTNCVVANNVIDGPPIGVNLNGPGVQNNVVIGNRLMMAVKIGPAIPGPGNITTPNY